MNALIKNAILLAVATGPKSAGELSRALGIPEEQLAPFTKHFVEKGTLLEEDGAYRRR